MGDRVVLVEALVSCPAYAVELYGRRVCLYHTTPREGEVR